jgi:beta-lactam-binding protein with PASTA domain
MRKTLLIIIAVLVLLIGSSCSGAAKEGEKDNSTVLLVPDVVGMELEDAKTAIKASCLVVGNIEYVESNDTGKEVVSNQDPLPGEEIKKGEQINLTVSAAAN